jgi:hypothetical protein
MSDKDPNERDIERRFLATVRAMGRQGTKHPMTQPALVGALVGGVIGMVVLDGLLWVFGAAAGGAAAIYMQLKK